MTNRLRAGCSTCLSYWPNGGPRRRACIKNLWERRPRGRGRLFRAATFGRALAPRNEYSAGVVIHAGSPRQYLLLHYPSGHWDFPKGHIEAGETELQAALREVTEETGIATVEIHTGFRHAFEYFYKRGAANVRKTVVYFVGRVEPQAVRVSHEHRGFVWLPFEKALAKITYRNAKDLLSAAERFVAETDGAKAGSERKP